MSIYNLSLMFLIGMGMLMSCNAQVKNEGSVAGTTRVGGDFENNEFTYIGIPVDINSTDTSAGWTDPGQRLLITGKVLKNDGKTPAAGVVLYYYQTNTSGRYVHKPEIKGSMPPNDLGQTHGYIRGWVKTGDDGKYAIYTVRPGSYPSGDEPAHIHVTVKEPNSLSEYYIDDFQFDDDKLLTTAFRKKLQKRSGNGILRLVKKDGLQVGERNIILGLNIPGYPEAKEENETSGLRIGEDVFSFIPHHAWGPDKGKRVCPVCKYGWYHGILYFVGNKPDWNEIKQWLTFLETESAKRPRHLKVYFVYGNDRGYSKSVRESELSKLGEELKLQKVALTFVPSFTDSESDVDQNKVNPLRENTFLLYKRSNVFDKYIDLKPTPENFAKISASLDQSINEYFDLPPIEQPE